MTSPIFIMSRRTTEPAWSGVIGKRRCHRCNQQVWISPATLAVLKREHDTRMTCMECFRELLLLMDPTDPPEFHTTDQQDMELFQAIGVTQSEAIHKLFGVVPKKLVLK